MQSILRLILCWSFCVLSAAAASKKAPAKTCPDNNQEPDSVATTPTAPPSDSKDQDHQNPKTPKPASVSTLSEDEIKDFAQSSPALQDLIRKSLELTRKNLAYQFGSADPTCGGMDCSGAVYYVLTEMGLKDVPRQSDLMCRWVMRHATLYRTENITQFSDLPFSAIQPGDLVFWTGTYAPTTPRPLFITHVMVYLGKRKKDNKPLLFGSSEGRSFDGERRNGVSVFDFKIPPPGTKGAMFGYGRIPGLNLEEIRKADVP